MENYQLMIFTDTKRQRARSDLASAFVKIQQEIEEENSSIEIVIYLKPKSFKLKKNYPYPQKYQ